jgi:hypothetical protein
MNLHEDVPEKSHRRSTMVVARHVYPTVSGTEGSNIQTEFTLRVGVPTGGVGEFFFGKYGAVYTGAAFIASGCEGYGKYEPEMVTRLLRLDIEAPEAKFNNIIDMMDWLNSD